MITFTKHTIHKHSRSKTSKTIALFFMTPPPQIECKVSVITYCRTITWVGDSLILCYSHITLLYGLVDGKEREVNYCS